MTDRKPAVSTTAGALGRHDAYVDYTRRFFERWVPVYDLFAATIEPVYRRAAKCVEPGPGQRVLDVCTGTGWMAVRCARRGASVSAIDLTAAMLDKARRRLAGLPAELKLADARQLPFEDSTFDTSVISLGLHDMPRRVRLEVLAEMRRVTRRRIVVVDYDFGRAGLLRRLLIRLVALFETSYFPRFAQEDPSALLDEAGWSGRETVAPVWPWSWFFSIHIVDRRTKRSGSIPCGPGDAWSSCRTACSPYPSPSPARRWPPRRSASTAGA